MHERDPLLSEQLEALRDVYDKVIGKYNFIETTELYRYTTSSGLKSIIEHKEIWATDIRFFNEWHDRIFAFYYRSHHGF